MLLFPNTYTKESGQPIDCPTESACMLMKNISITKNLNNEKIVIIQDIIFKGRQNVAWYKIETYLR